MVEMFGMARSWTYVVHPMLVKTALVEVELVSRGSCLVARAELLLLYLPSPTLFLYLSSRSPLRLPKNLLAELLLSWEYLLTSEISAICSTMSATLWQMLATS